MLQNEKYFHSVGYDITIFGNILYKYHHSRFNGKFACPCLQNETLKLISKLSMAALFANKQHFETSLMTKWSISEQFYQLGALFKQLINENNRPSSCIAKLKHDVLSTVLRKSIPHRN